MRDGNLCKNARSMGLYIEEQLNNKLSSLKIVKDIRVKGLMIGIEPVSYTHLTLPTKA